MILQSVRKERAWRSAFSTPAKLLNAAIIPLLNVELAFVASALLISTMLTAISSQIVTVGSLCCLVKQAIELLPWNTDPASHFTVTPDQ